MTHVGDPIQIGAFTLKNRLTMAPTVKFDYTDETGLCTQKLVDHYSKRAKGGIGLICVEATAVTPEGRFCPNHMGLWEDAQIEGHKAITKACHEEGVVVIIQLNHASTGNFYPVMGEQLAPSDLTVADHTARGLSLDEVHELQKAYVAAAVRAQKAGYDGIQLHGCHGYMINNFMSPYTNHREDEYGGDLVNRARFASEIIAQIRKECGENFLISIRIAGAEPDFASSIAMAEEYVKAGCQYLQVSFGTTQAYESKPGDDFSYTDIQAFGKAFHDHFAGRVPVSTVGGILSPEMARDLIESGATDTLDLARGMLADPNFPNAILKGSDYVKCYDCKKGCQYGPGAKHLCPAALKRGLKGCD